MQKRAFAATIDIALVATGCLLYFYWSSTWFIVAGAIYVLFRDAVQGRSLGKFLMGLVVIKVETGAPATLIGSLGRNFLFVVPGANVAAIFLEALTTVRDPQGQRLGDKLARTQVVEGLGAKDVAKLAEEWRRSVLAELRPGLRRPDSEPADVKPF